MSTSIGGAVTEEVTSMAPSGATSEPTSASTAQSPASGQPYGGLTVTPTGMGTSAAVPVTGSNSTAVSGATSQVTEAPASNQVTDFNSFVTLLKAGGATVSLGQTVSQAAFPVSGKSITVNGEDVLVFEFTSVSNREATSNLISSNGTSLGNQVLTWAGSPTIWAAGQLIVVYMGTSSTTRQQLDGILGNPIARPAS